MQYMVEVMFAIRKDSFKAHPAIISDLDLVEEDDQFTHLLQLDDVTAGHEQLSECSVGSAVNQCSDCQMQRISAGKVKLFIPLICWAAICPSSRNDLKTVVN